MSSQEFEIASNEPSQGKLNYLGMDLNFINNGILVSQTKYSENILNKFGFSDAYEVSTPMEPGMMTDRHVNDKDLTDKPFREAVGSLLYLSTMSRADISFAVNYVSRKVNKPKISHWIIERIFRYLKGTVHYGIFFDGNNKRKFIRIQTMEVTTVI